MFDRQNIFAIAWTLSGLSVGLIFDVDTLISASEACLDRPANRPVIIFGRPLLPPVRRDARAPAAWLPGGMAQTSPP